MIEEEQVETINEASSSLSSYLEQYGLRILLAIALFFVFTKIIRRVVELLQNFLSKRKIDPKIADLVVSLTRYMLYLVLILFLATFIGIDIAFVVILIIAAIAVIAFTMQDTLVNVGAGFIIVGLKLFKKGNYIEFGDIEGDVKSIDIYNTEIIRSDNSIVFVPNADLLNGKVVNTDKLRKKRVDVVVYVSFENKDIDKLRKIMLSVVKGDERILEGTEPKVIVRDLDKVSIKMRLSLWVKKADYWDVLYDYNEKVVKALQKNQVIFPENKLIGWLQEEK